MNLVEQIDFYFKKRGLTYPDFQNAMKWVQTELGEVYEQDLARSGNWVRNNPQDHEGFSKLKLGEELGDVVFMLIVAGMAEGIDVIDCMQEKMARKLQEQRDEQDTELKVMKGTSALTFLDGIDIQKEMDDMEKELKEQNEK